MKLGSFPSVATASTETTKIITQTGSGISGKTTKIKTVTEKRKTEEGQKWSQ